MAPNPAQLRAYQNHAQFAQPPNSKLTLEARVAALERGMARLTPLPTPAHAPGPASARAHAPAPASAPARGPAPGPARAPGPGPTHARARARAPARAPAPATAPGPAPAPAPARRPRQRRSTFSYVVRLAPGAPEVALEQLSMSHLDRLYKAFHGRMPPNTPGAHMTPERARLGSLGGPGVRMRVPHVRGTRTYLKWCRFVSYYNSRRSPEGLSAVEM